MNYLILPSGDRIYAGDIVTLSRFPGTKWILQNGWYFYESRQQNGWYFSSIPADTVIPVNDSDLLSLTVISTQSMNGCPPFYPGENPAYPHPPHPPHPPCPAPPHPGHRPHPGHKPHPDDMAVLSKHAVTVQNISQRNALAHMPLQHGKIVRVNDVEGQIRYYEWDAINFTWIDIQLSEGMIKTLDTFADDLVTKSSDDWEDSDEKLATCGALTERIKVVSGPKWGSIQ